VLGYFISDIDIYEDEYIIKAPAIDGVYYSGSIDMAYIFDVESDAMICYYNLPAIVSDKPLSLNMPEINVIFESNTPSAVE